LLFIRIIIIKMFIIINYIDIFLFMIATSINFNDENKIFEFSPFINIDTFKDKTGPFIIEIFQRQYQTNDEGNFYIKLKVYIYIFFIK